MRSSASQSPFRAVAHELLNPLASLRGGIESIAAGEQPGDVRWRLLDIVRRQSVRLEWLVRAAVTDPRTVPLRPARFDAGAAVRDAATLCGVRPETDIDVTPVRADEQTFRLAVEAVLMAMTHGGARTALDVTPARIRVASEFADRGDQMFVWKLRLARELLRRNGMRMRAAPLGDGSAVTIWLPGAAALRSVS